MQITLATFYTDGSVQHQTTSQFPDERAALGWALANWHPARSCRIPGGDGYYLNDRLMLAVDGGAFENVRDVVERISA